MSENPLIETEDDTIGQRVDDVLNSLPHEKLVELDGELTDGRTVKIAGRSGDFLVTIELALCDEGVEVTTSQSQTPNTLTEGKPVVAVQG
jgi:hypothetical protein